MRVTLPAEWQPNEACWFAWPNHPEEWLGDLEAPRRTVAAFCKAVATAEPLAGQVHGERIEMLVASEEDEASARSALHDIAVRYHRIPFGDIWLRDTGPIFVYADNNLQAACFEFNGWGGKYLFQYDPEVSERIAAAAHIPVTHHDWILEGGAIDVDGEGTALTTRQCLLNKNRNPSATQASVENQLAEALGIKAVIWLDCGLQNDHTDGHVDTLARFVASATVVCMRAVDSDDPNRHVLEQISHDLRGARDAKGRRLNIIEIPSPGLVRGSRNEILPASYANFYIGNRAVVVPTYGTRHDEEAVQAIAALFPTRRTIGIDAHGIITGGGAFHCITRQQPIRQFVNND